MPKVFLDTNILVYATDQADTVKRDKARGLLRRAAGEEHLGVISTQVLQEFYVAATRKLAVDPVQAKLIMGTLNNLEIVTVTPSLITGAIDCSLTDRLSFWDALIVVAAESARCQTIWTEDLNPGQTIRGVRIENPFIEA